MTTPTIALAAGATVLSLAFVASTYERWLTRRTRHELAWTIALVLFACGAASLWIGATFGWNEVSFRFFYTFGAVLNVPVLALGTIYLLGGQRRGDRVAIGIAVVLAFAAGVITVAPINPTFQFDASTLPRGSAVFGVLPRACAALASTAGALVIFVGAIWSAARMRKNRPRLVIGNLVIALGTTILSMSGLLNSLLGEMQAFGATLTLGVAVLFMGFLISTSLRSELSAQYNQLQDSRENNGEQQNGHGNGGSKSHGYSIREVGRSDTGTETSPMSDIALSSLDESKGPSVNSSPTSSSSSAAAD